MDFDANDQAELLRLLLGSVSLATMFVFTIRSLGERIGCFAQLGLFTIFLVIGGLTSPYFYLVLPLYLLTRVVVAFAARNKPSE